MPKKKKKATNKKKAKAKDVDPTLINKPITGNVGILKDILGKKDVDSIEKSKQLFFDYVIFKHHKKNPKKIPDKDKKKLISDISQKQMGIYLKDRKNTFFRRVDQVLSKNAEDFVKSFIELLFRTKMKDIEGITTPEILKNFEHNYHHIIQQFFLRVKIHLNFFN